MILGSNLSFMRRPTALEVVQSCFQLTHFGILYDEPKPKSRVLAATNGSSSSSGEHSDWCRCTTDIIRCAMCKYLKNIGCYLHNIKCCVLYAKKKEKRKEKKKAQSYLIYWYELEEELLEYASGPTHVNVVKECVLSICDDIMAVDWVAEGLVPGPVAPVSTIWLTLAKLKEAWVCKGHSSEGHSEKCYASAVTSLQAAVR